MFRILIIEDQEGTLTQLEALLAENFPGSLIDKAETVAEARRLIEGAFESARAYDAVILDFMLPKDIGENPEPDESICELIRQKMGRALIAHITAYPEDPKVHQHLRRAHVEEFGHVAFAHSKVSATWAIQLLQKLKAYLHGKRILGRLRLLFDDSEAGRSHVRAACGLTHEIANLSNEITEHWRDLDDKARQEIASVFNVVIDENQNAVRVGLL